MTGRMQRIRSAGRKRQYLNKGYGVPGGNGGIRKKKVGIHRQEKKAGEGRQHGYREEVLKMNNKGNDVTERQGNRGWKAACVLFLGAALICTAVACAGKENQSRAEDEYEKLSEQTGGTASTPKPEETEPESEIPVETEEPPEEKDPMAVLEELGVPVPEKTVDFAELKENTNEDIYAWIYIPDTKIDYPVLQHPTDNYYYLNYNLDGSKGYPGCIYTEDYNRKDFTDPVTVMYGHNMKNGTMFAGLHRYSDSLYMEEHPYVYIYTEEGLLVYEVFSAHEYSDAHILYNHDYTQSTEFEGYLEDIRNARDMGRVLREDVEVTEESRILTLSTCIANKPNNRFLVQGVLLNGEQ